jgi:hypothetical protein
MKTNPTQIAEVYRAYLGEQKVEPGVGCPTPEGLVQFVIQGVDRKARARIMEHVSNCADCALVLKSILRLSGEIDKLTGKAEAFQCCPQDEVLGKKERVRLIPGRRAAVAILAGMIGLTIITLSVIKISNRPVVRGTARSRILLLSPKQGATYPAEEIEFKWEAVPKAARYTVELFNRSLEKVWRSGPVSNAGTELPAEARRVILEGETYFWRVTVVLEDGAELISKLAEFSIRK